MFLDLSRSGLNRGRCFFWNLWATISDVSGLSQYNGRDLLLRLHNENKTWFNDSRHFWSRNILSLRAYTCINIYSIVDYLMDMTLQIKPYLQTDIQGYHTQERAGYDNCRKPTRLKATWGILYKEWNGEIFLLVFRPWHHSRVYEFPKVNYRIEVGNFNWNYQIHGQDARPEWSWGWTLCTVLSSELVLLGPWTRTARTCLWGEGSPWVTKSHTLGPAYSLCYLCRR